jgi:hydroxymethylpyrimidine/phosphomethylpyrimidine kinase
MSKRSTDQVSTGNIVIGLPCEYVTAHLLPLVRRLLAQELVNKHGMSQIWTAKVLNVTQPAVSNYLHSETRLRRGALEEGVEDARNAMEGLAEDLINGRLTQFDAMRRVCGLCVQMRGSGPICSMHGEDIPSILPGQCSFCLRDLTEIRQKPLDDFEYVEEVRRAIRQIERTREMTALIPEIGMNIVYARPGAESVEDVVGVPGRIHPVGGRPRASSPPALGGSNHVARAVLTMMQFEPSLCSAISLRFDWEFVEICKELGLVVSSYDRKEEPRDVKSVDGRTIPWGVRRAVEGMDQIPEVIYDLGDLGKEPMIFLYGHTATEVAQTSVRIAQLYSRRHSNRKRGGKGSPV